MSRGMLPALLGAVGISLALFWLMQALIRGQGPDDLSPATDYAAVDFIRLRPEPPPAPKPARPPPAPLRPPPPKPPAPAPRALQAPRIPAPDLPLPALDLPLNLAGPALDGLAVVPGGAPPALDRDLVPLYRIAPRYPLHAARRGIEGWVELHFTVTETGGVRDVAVAKSEPQGVFDNAAMRAILKWRFEPRRVDGKPVARRAVQVLEFKLAS